MTSEEQFHPVLQKCYRMIALSHRERAVKRLWGLAHALVLLGDHEGAVEVGWTAQLLERRVIREHGT